MTRLRILPLPPSETELNPFAVVLDGFGRLTAASGEFAESIAQQLGARGVIGFAELVDIPAIDPPPTAPDVPRGVRFSIVCGEDGSFPADFDMLGWTVMRSVKLPGLAPPSLVVDLVGVTVPAAAEGKVINPMFVRHDDGTVTVYDYGIPAGGE